MRNVFYHTLCTISQKYRPLILQNNNVIRYNPLLYPQSYLKCIWIDTQPAQIIFGPLDNGGINLPHIYTFQCLGQLQVFLGHLRENDKIGTLILISISNLQLITGSSISFLKLPYPKYAKWILQGWLTSLWQFLSRAKFVVEIKQ